MAELVYLQFHNNMTFQDAVIEYEVGILLCTEKGDTLVKYATAGLNPNIFVQKYMIELPSEEEIKEFIASSNY